VPVHIDEIESDIELDGGGAEGSAPGQRAATTDSGTDVIERRARDAERTRAWDFDD